MLDSVTRFGTKLNDRFPICPGICTCSSPTTTFSRWRTGSSTPRPTRCPSSARAACRMKPHRTRRSRNRNGHLKPRLRRSRTRPPGGRAHRTSHQYPEHRFDAGSGSGVTDSRFLSSKGCCDCKSFRWAFLPAGTSLFVDNQDKHDFCEKSTFVSFLLSSVRKPV